MENFYKNFLRKIQKTLNIYKTCSFCEIQNNSGKKVLEIRKKQPLRNY